MGILDAPPAELKRLAAQLGITTTGQTPVQISTAITNRLQPIIEARQQFALRERLLGATAGIRGAAIGNSIVQGTGASGGNGWWTTQFGTLMATRLGLGSQGSWSPANWGNAGSVLSERAGLLADYSSDNAVDGQAATAGAVFYQRLSPNRSPQPYYVIGGARNEVTAYAAATTAGRKQALDDYRVLLAATIDAALAREADVIVYSDPPQLSTPGANALSQMSSDYDELFTAIQRDVCRQRGCTYVDWREYAMRQFRAGVNITQWYADATHPNDAGYLIIAQQLVQAIVDEPLQPVAQRPDLKAGRLQLIVAGRLTPNGTNVALSGSNGNAPIRKFTDGDGTNGTILNLNAGEKTVFNTISALAYPIMVTRGGGVLSYETTGGTVLATLANDGGLTERNVLGRRYGLGVQQKLNTQVRNSNGSGVLHLTGLLSVGPVQTGYLPTVALGTANTGFADQTPTAPNQPYLGATANAAEVTVPFTGTGLALHLMTLPTGAKIDVYVDGSTTVSATLDTYAAANADTQMVAVTGLRYGLHTARLVVNGRNASNTTGYDTRIYQVVSLDERTYPRDSLAIVTAGQTVGIGTRYTHASIDRVMSGTPVISASSPMNGTVTVTGGAALVRLR